MSVPSTTGTKVAVPYNPLPSIWLFKLDNVLTLVLRRQDRESALEEQLQYSDIKLSVLSNRKHAHPAPDTTSLYSNFIGEFS